MIEAALLRWVLTVVFGGTALWFLLCTGRRGASLLERISAMSHVAMSALMVPMAWSWGMRIPTLPQIVVMSLAGVWFLGLALGSARSGAGGEHEHASGRIHHVLMMVAMVWMLATMPQLMAAAPGDTGSGGHHHGAASDTAGSAASSSSPVELPVWITIVTVALAGYLILSSLAWIAAAVDRGREVMVTSPSGGGDTGSAEALSLACHGAMSIGMGAMLLAALPL